MNKPLSSKEKLKAILKGEFKMPKLVVFEHLTTQECIEYSALCEQTKGLLPHQFTNEQLERSVYFILKKRGEKVSYPLSEQDHKRVKYLTRK
ncbi:hypothetical protein [Xanthocytophaga agilis]|uniref:Uncharacterized protein n=1 Tax=Xanthocytophaga agilis TaxID=3048010 RepID=A0AAE3R5I4_9BACT|nr:hypothetical protein [Xanthocytophaga agilis]MDJ1501829.1 hypothetical protein [Xanthocytophaga agilis]